MPKSTEVGAYEAQTRLPTILREIRAGRGHRAAIAAS